MVSSLAILAPQKGCPANSNTNFNKVCAGAGGEAPQQVIAVPAAEGNIVSEAAIIYWRIVLALSLLLPSLDKWAARMSKEVGFECVRPAITILL